MAEICVVVPVYQVELYLKRCLDSILRQSFSDFRLILVNDGSTDASGAICEAYRQKDRRIEVIHQENQGLSMARNRGLELSEEKYVTFIDSDDFIHPEMLEILYENIVENKADISICKHRPVDEANLELIDQEQEKRGVSGLFSQGKNKADSLLDRRISMLTKLEAVNKILDKSDTNMIIACGKLYKRSLFGSIRYPKGKYHEDEFVTYKLLYKAQKIVLSEAELLFYIQRKDSITGSSYSLKRLEKLEALKEAIEFFKDTGNRELEVKARSRYLFNIQIAYYRVKYELQDRPQDKARAEVKKESKNRPQDKVMGEMESRAKEGEFIESAKATKLVKNAKHVEAVKSLEYILDKLKKEYDSQYKELLKKNKEMPPALEGLPLARGVILRFFYLLPNLYCRMVKIYLIFKTDFNN